MIATEHQEATPNLLSPRQPSPETLRTSPCPRICRSPIPHTARVASDSPPSPSSTSARLSTPSLSDDEARRALETWMRDSKWRRQNEIEPLVGDPGVPACALQLAKKGQSVYCCFLVPVKVKKGKASGWRPATDPKSKPDRLRRVIGRERAKLGHCPFKCPGDHDPDCDFKGCSKENLGDHLASRNNPMECPRCSEQIAAKNMQRHLRALHKR